LVWQRIDTIAFNLREGRALDANKAFDAKYEQLKEVAAGTF